MNQFSVCRSIGLGLKIDNERQEVCVKGGIEILNFALSTLSLHATKSAAGVRFCPSAKLCPRQAHVFIKIWSYFPFEYSVL